MALNLTAGQFEDAYRPCRLGNWEMARTTTDPNQLCRRGRTKIIADDRGHLLKPAKICQNQENDKNKNNQKLEENKTAVSSVEYRKKDSPKNSLTSNIDKTSPISLDNSVKSLKTRNLTRCASSISSTKSNNHSLRRHKTSTELKGRKTSDDDIDNNKFKGDTIEDALLPHDLDKDRSSKCRRAYAYRFVEHPGATNCTKFSILRPYTASSVDGSSTVSVCRPHTTKMAPRTITEIEYAIKWDLKKEVERVQEYNKRLERKAKSRNESKRSHTPRSATSINSDDSGISMPRNAWIENEIAEKETNKHDLKIKLDSLANTARQVEEKENYESGYNTPVSVCSKLSLPSVKSAKSVAKVKTRSFKEKLDPLMKSNENVEMISLDSKLISSKAKLSKSMPCLNSPNIGERNHLDENKKIRETVDSVFQKIPLKDEEENISKRDTRESKLHEIENISKDNLKNVYTQTDPHKNGDNLKHNFKPPIRARTCIACDLKSFADDSKKNQKLIKDPLIPFSFGKIEKKLFNRPLYTKQSERYQSKLKSRYEQPRDWKIETLKAPFNNRPGYGQDQYPNHMRLQTTYQISHSQNKTPFHSMYRRLYM